MPATATKYTTVPDGVHDHLDTYCTNVWIPSSAPEWGSYWRGLVRYEFSPSQSNRVSICSSRVNIRIIHSPSIPYVVAETSFVLSASSGDAAASLDAAYDLHDPAPTTLVTT